MSFTGGVAVGKSIATRLGYRRAVLELGGNDPLIVLADADLEEAAGAGGPRRLPELRPALHGGQADHRGRVGRRRAWPSASRPAARALRAGDPSDERTDVGTVIDEPAARVIEGASSRRGLEGARLLHGRGARRRAC